METEGMVRDFSHLFLYIYIYIYMNILFRCYKQLLNSLSPPASSQVLF